MKNPLSVCIVLALFFSCTSAEPAKEVVVSTSSELHNAIKQATAGTSIVMQDGEWSDINIRLAGFGTEVDPITLKAETPGGVKITGSSSLKIGGEYLVVDGLYFTQGSSPSGAVIEFAIHEDTVANHCRVTNTVIDGFNKAQRNQTDLWVQLKGRYNQLDHCYLAGKSNRGPTVRVDLAGNRSIKNYHQINNNHFGPRPPKGGPSAETIQIGNSFTSMAPSHTIVENNLFEHCNGEVEVISSKTNFNVFKGNVFYQSQGSLVTRHGNYCEIDGNYFIGDKDSPYVGGVRLIGTGHWVTNNYFFDLKGEAFRAPIAVMNGIPKSSINRYIQVTDVNVAYNTFINCTSPWHFGVGSNVDQKDVLPASEIRSLTPIRTTFANNIIFNKVGDKRPIYLHDDIDGITFKQNAIDNQNVAFDGVQGLREVKMTIQELESGFWFPQLQTEMNPYQGFEYDQITEDLLGNSRVMNNTIGAALSKEGKVQKLKDFTVYGPSWWKDNSAEFVSEVHRVANEQELIAALGNATDGDTIRIEAARLKFDASLAITKKVTIESSEDLSSILRYEGMPETPLFELYPGGELSLKNLKIEGTGKNYTFSPLKKDMSSLYNLFVYNTEISNFNSVLRAYKYSFSEYIRFENSKIFDCENGIQLAAETDDRGDYNAENVTIVDCTFKSVRKNVIDYYRGGYDESTVGGNLQVFNSVFTDCGTKERSKILIKTYGIINVSLRDNTFENNQVQLVARLWGAKNNIAAGNELSNSGKIISEENLPLKLMY